MLPKAVIRCPAMPSGMHHARLAVMPSPATIDQHHLSVIQVLGSVLLIEGHGGGHDVLQTVDQNSLWRVSRRLH